MLRVNGAGKPASLWRVLALVAALVLALAVVACGDDDDDGGGGGGADTSASTDAGGGDTSGGGGIDVEPKTLVYGELVGDASEIAARSSEAMRLATEALGWEMDYIEGQGDIPGLIKGLSGAINAGGDAVIITSTDAPLVQPALELAKRKGIPVIATGGESAPSDLFTAQYQESEAEMSKLLTEQMIEDLGGKGKIGVLDNTQISAGVIRQKAREEALKGTDIETVARQDTDLADLTGGAKKAVAAMLTQEPNMDAFWLVYDAMMPGGVESLQTRKSDAKMYSWFANPSNLELMRKVENVQALADNNYDHTSLIGLDQLVRYFQDGTEPDPDALKNCPLKYAVVTRDDMPPEGEILFPVADNVQPFIDNWEQGKFGEGADCG